ncbi:MAG: hypothetical protein ACRCXA_11730 [Peptostreptococcaceae bacterium]
MHKGYIGITDNKWATFIIENNIKNVNFWCKKHSFKAINQGEIFFFLKKNDDVEKKRKIERKLIGYGIFDKFEVLNIEDAWNKYGIGNGCSSREQFVDNISLMYDLEGNDVKIGNIILNEVTIFQKPMYLSELEIDFANAIVSGKTITIDEVNKILNTAEIEVDYIEIDEELNITDDSIDEGKKIKLIINSRKRNSKVRKLKLEHFIREHGSVFCEVCNENDIIALDIHHDKVQVSDMQEGHRTKLSDLRVICASCHRKVHGHKTTVDELISKYK